jgi:hypothetical protein
MSFHTLQSRIAVRACLQRAEIVHAWVPNIWCAPYRQRFPPPWPVLRQIPRSRVEYRTTRLVGAR